jgi:HlyD family secretion protein
VTWRSRPIVLATAGAVLALAAFLVSVLDRHEPLAVTTVEVTRGPVRRQVFATGVVQPVRTVDVGAQVSGTIQSLEADFNSPVRTGQVIARLDPSVYRTRLIEAQGKAGQAEGEAIRLRTVLDDARVKLQRAQELTNQDLVPKTELEAAQLTVRQTEAELKAAQAATAAARAEIAQEQVNLEHTIIRSPVDGIVIDRLVDPGQTLASSLQTPILFRIADLRKMQILAEIGEGDVGGVRPGSPVSFAIEAIGQQSFNGVVRDVRLQPIVEQPAAATGGAGTSATPVATSGSPTSPTASNTAGSAASTSSSPTSSAATQTTAVGAQTTTSSNTQTAATTKPAGTGVVNYAAVIDLDNSDGRLTPGSTAILTLDGAERPDAVRIPNTALSFRPSAAVLDAIEQQPPALERTTAAGRGLSRRAYVWKYENRRFVPILVETGLADDRWTEVIGGSLQPGDVLITSAARRDRP